MTVHKARQPGLSSVVVQKMIEGGRETVALPRLRLDHLHLQLSIRRAIKELTA